MVSRSSCQVVGSELMDRASLRWYFWASGGACRGGLAPALLAAPRSVRRRRRPPAPPRRALPPPRSAPPRPDPAPAGPCVIPPRTPLPTPFDRSTFRSLARLAPARRPPQARCRAACALLLRRLGNAPGTAPRRPLHHPFTDAASDALRPESVPFLGTARARPPAAPP